MRDVDALAQQMIEATQAFVARSESAINKRIEELDARLKALPAPQDGKDADPEVMRAEIARAVAQIPPAKNGADADPAVTAKLVAEAVAAIPRPADGKSITVEDVAPFIVAEVCKAVAEIPKPKDVDPVAIKLMVSEAVAAIPRPKDGESVHPDTIVLMIRDAADKIVAAMPRPKDGADGFSLDDFDVSLSEDGRTLTLKFQRGDVVKERAIKLHMINYREVWREGEYERGDVVSWGGSSWHCQRTTTEKPAYGCADWIMLVKRGDDGRDFDDPKARSNRPVVRLK